MYIAMPKCADTQVRTATFLLVKILSFLVLSAGCGACSQRQRGDMQPQQQLLLHFSPSALKVLWIEQDAAPFNPAALHTDDTACYTT